MAIDLSQLPDLMPLEQVNAMFDVGDTIMLQRRNDLRIKFVKDERDRRRNLLRKSDVELLLELDIYIRSGGITSEFLKRKGLPPRPKQSKYDATTRVHPSDETPSQRREASPLGQGVESADSGQLTVVGDGNSPEAVLMEVIDRLLYSNSVPAFLSRTRYLHELSQMPHLLSSSEVLEMLNRKSLPRLQRDGKAVWFEFGGYRFTRVSNGRRQGEWRVSVQGNG